MDVIQTYLDYNKETESPYIYHRWCAITSIGSLLARNVHMPFGNARIFPNLYIMLLGDAGARKSSAIKAAKKLITAAGYTSIAANKTRIEKFLLDLEGLTQDEGQQKEDVQVLYDQTMSANLWGINNDFTEPRESFIMADEWSVFAGTGNLDMYDVLGDMWDWDEPNIPFKHRLKNSKSVNIFQPTINILGGSNLTNFIRAFPPETLEHGILSRMILIGGERSERKYTIPPKPPEEMTESLVGAFRNIREFHGVYTISPAAFKILDTLYNSWIEVNDTRFRSYNNRRYTQLLKLCIIHAASVFSLEISEEIVVTANTVLSAAEAGMPKALGEFGKSRNSDIANKIMDFLYAATKAVSIKEIWAVVHQDLEKAQTLQEIIQSLILAEKVQHIKDMGYLPKMKVQSKKQFVDWSLLTVEERKFVSHE